MRRADLERLSQKLRHQRHAIVEEIVDVDADLEIIAADREAELEERAQEEQTSQLLVHLDERSRREVGEIDAALERIASGAYGTCEDCGAKIALARLGSVPATRFCVSCAETHEAPRGGTSG